MDAPNKVSSTASRAGVNARTITEKTQPISKTLDCASGYGMVAGGKYMRVYNQPLRFHKQDNVLWKVAQQCLK